MGSSSHLQELRPPEVKDKCCKALKEGREVERAQVAASEGGEIGAEADQQAVQPAEHRGGVLVLGLEWGGTSGRDRKNKVTLLELMPSI